MIHPGMPLNAAEHHSSEHHLYGRITLWLTALSIVVLFGTTTGKAQCYEFISGTAADLKINLVSLPTPSVNITTGPFDINYQYTYSQLFGPGEGASLQVGSNFIGTPVLTIPYVFLANSFNFYDPARNPPGEYDSGLSGGAAFLDPNSGKLIGASVSLISHNGAYFNSGLGSSIPPISVWDGDAEIDLNNPDGTTAQIFPITSIDNCNPSSIATLPINNIATGASPSGISPMVAAADFNGDGFQDLVLTNLTDASVSVLLGNGSGGFATPVKYATGKGPYGVMAGDFNGDGKPDIAVVNGTDNTVSILLNNKTGGFPSKPSFTYAVGSEPFGISTADLNNDGVLDLVITNNGSSSVSVLIGNGDGTFQSQVTYGVDGYPFSTALADLNKDGYLDIVAENANDNNVSVLLNDAMGRFGAQTTNATGTAPFSVTTGDFNRDGYPDVAVANLGSNTITVLLNNTTGKLLPGVTYATGMLPTSVVAADLNGDGLLDLAVTNLGDDTVGLLLGKGDGTFMPQTTYAALAQPYSLVAADFNNDGKLDLAVTSFYSPTVGILLQTSTSSPSSKPKEIPKRAGPPVTGSPKQRLH